MTTPTDDGGARAASIGLACAVLAIFAVGIMYSLWLPSIILGAVGIALGIGAEGMQAAGRPVVNWPPRPLPWESRPSFSRRR